MELQLKPNEAELLIAVLKYAEDAAHEFRYTAMKLAIRDLRPMRSALLQAWLRSKLANVEEPAGVSPDQER